MFKSLFISGVCCPRCSIHRSFLEFVVPDVQIAVHFWSLVSQTFKSPFISIKSSKIIQNVQKILRKSSKMIDLPLHLPMNTYLSLSTKKIRNSANKNSEKVSAIPCDICPSQTHPAHAIPQSSRINIVDLILCSNLPQLRYWVI